MPRLLPEPYRPLPARPQPRRQPRPRNLELLQHPDLDLPLSTMMFGRHKPAMHAGRRTSGVTVTRTLGCREFDGGLTVDASRVAPIAAPWRSTAMAARQSIARRWFAERGRRRRKVTVHGLQARVANDNSIARFEVRRFRSVLLAEGHIHGSPGHRPRNCDHYELSVNDASRPAKGTSMETNDAEPLAPVARC